MCTEQQLALVMRQVVEAAKAAFGASVRQVILFGSYARGAAEEDSDVDVMILLDLPREQLPAHRRGAPPKNGGGGVFGFLVVLGFV